jgi:hypothetical protein
MKKRVVLVLAVLFALPQATHAQGFPTAMQKVYRDESHCLTRADMRSDKDNPISCHCRDAIEDARYVYFAYFLPHKDDNLTGVFLHLQDYAGETCSRDTAERLDMAFISKIEDATTLKDWKWSGPEVVRTYPPDDVIKRIKPSGATRWIPFTVQLVYRDAQGRVTRTEEYSSREPVPVFPEKP